MKFNKRNTWFWLKKNWYFVLGGIAIVIAFIILVIHNTLHDDLWIRIVQSLYNSLSLVVLEGGNFAFPAHASITVKIILWICYFIAPLITIAFIIRYFQERILNHIPKKINDHIIICGLGRNGKIIYDLVSEKYPAKKIVVIEKDESNAYGDKLVKASKTWWLKKDFAELPILLKAGAERASNIYITPNLDMINLTAVMNILEKITDTCKISCHIGEVQLYSNITNVFASDKAKEILPKLANTNFFNGYRFATKRLFEEKVFKKNKISPNGNIYVFFGFGRFAQMLYNHIVEFHFKKEVDLAIIVSLNSELFSDPRNYTWSNKITGDKIEPEIFKGDMNNYDIWDKIVTFIQKDQQNNEKPLHLFNCRDSDVANINLAISMKTSGPELLQKGSVYCRTYTTTHEKLETILIDSLSTNEHKKDIVLFPVFEELKTAFNSELFVETKSTWTYEEFLAYVFLYAANADQKVTTEEKNMLLSKVPFKEYENVRKDFESKNDTNRLETILSFKDQYFSDEDARNKLLSDLQEMFLADDEFNSIEKAYLLILKKILK